MGNEKKNTSEMCDAVYSADKLFYFSYLVAENGVFVVAVGGGGWFCLFFAHSNYNYVWLTAIFTFFVECVQWIWKVDSGMKIENM